MQTDTTGTAELTDEEQRQAYINAPFNEDDIAGLRWLLEKAQAKNDEMAPIYITQEGAEKLLRQLPRLMAAAEAAERVIAPFAKAVFYDNGDVTVSKSHLTTHDYLAARDWQLRHATQRQGGDDDHADAETADEALAEYDAEGGTSLADLKRELGASDDHD